MPRLIDIVYLTCAILFLGFIPVFLLWNHWFNKDPFKHSKTSRWTKFRKKTPIELQLESAKNLLSRGSYGQAEILFRTLLKSLPDDVGIHLGLAECLFDQSIKGVKKDPAKKAEALEHYKWVIGFYTKAGESGEILALYKRLLGPYSESELGIFPQKG